MMQDEKFISVIIPNRNGEATIERCLEAAFASHYSNFEVIVVDDFSTDASIELIKKFPCKLVRLEKHSGVSKARNAGAKAARGEVLFFIDSDCLLKSDALALANKTMLESGAEVVGGTYTKVPYLKNFFDSFQSIYVNYVETKHSEPDYLAAHCMAIDARVFRELGGFVEDSFIGFTASVEDIEFSHRLRKAGHKLLLNPRIQVQHIFNFTLFGSLRNAAKKTKYWTMYHVYNRDFLSDSGASSAELKVNVAGYFSSAALVALYFVSKNAIFLSVVPIVITANLFFNRRLLAAFYEAGAKFALLALAYYALLYPLAVGAGVIAGLTKYFWNITLLGRHR